MIRRKNFRYVIDDTPSPLPTLDLYRRGHTLVKGAFTAAETEELRADLDDVFDRYPPDLRAGRATAEMSLAITAGYRRSRPKCPPKCPPSCAKRSWGMPVWGQP